MSKDRYCQAPYCNCELKYWFGTIIRNCQYIEYSTDTANKEIKLEQT